MHYDAKKIISVEIRDSNLCAKLETNRLRGSMGHRNLLAASKLVKVV